MMMSGQVSGESGGRGERVLTVDGSHDESDLHGIRGTREMRVNLLGLVLVQRHEPVEDVVAGSGVIGATLVVGEVVLHRRDGQLLLEAIDLVQEQDDGRLDEPSRVADGVEKRQRLLHTVHRLILEKQLVVLGDGDKEENRGDVLEAVDPLLTFRPLTTDIEHAVGEVADDEGRLGDTGRLDTRAEDILIVRNVVGGGDAVDRVEVAVRGSASAKASDGVVRLGASHDAK